MINNRKFEKISLNEYQNSDLSKLISTDEYNQIKLPKRATISSAGYDFFMPYYLEIKPNCEVKIPTGIRCRMNHENVLLLYPRSSLGFKYNLKLNNTIGVIDSDYYNSDNEGHIYIKMTNFGNNTIILNKGDAFCQGVFMNYLLTEDDNTTEIRNGGFGSTNK